MFVISDGLESRLRKVAERKGDLSIIAEKALNAWLTKVEADNRLYDVEEEAQRRE